jgi:electron transfer flavoprotein alpha subunit
MSVLVLAEHDNVSLKDATLNVVSAAKALAGHAGGDVHVLVAGQGCGAAAAAAAKIEGVAKVLLADVAAYGAALAENVAPLVAGLMANYDAFVAPATSLLPTGVQMVARDAHEQVADVTTRASGLVELRRRAPDQVG